MATASRVLAGAVAGEQTRQRVLAAADEIGYVPNGPARAMTGRGRRMLAFLSHEVVGATFTAIAMGAERVASEAGHLMLIGTTHGDPEREAELVTTLREQRVGAILLVGSSDMDEQFTPRAASYATSLATIGAKLVLCGRPRLPGHPEILSVDYDQAGGIAAAVAHLVGLGHRRIGYLGEQEGRSTLTIRLHAYRAALAKHDLDWTPDLEEVARNTPESSAAVASMLFEQGVTAVVCMTDIMAIGVYRAAASLGLEIPDDLSVIGFDDAPLVADLRPGLTTVRVPFGQLGEVAAQRALGESGGLTSESLPTEIVIRDSTRSPRR